MITYEQFKEVDMRIARVISAERVEGSDKLIKLTLDCGDKNETGDTVSRQVVAGIGKAYEPEQLTGTQVAIVANLAPRLLMGLESNGMIIAARDENGLPVLIRPEKAVPEGTQLS